MDVQKIFVKTNDGDPNVTYDNPQKENIWSYYKGIAGVVHATGAVSTMLSAEHVMRIYSYAL